jgi:hypothetical protein
MMTEFVLSYVEPAQERIVRRHLNKEPCCEKESVWFRMRPLGGTEPRTLLADLRGQLVYETLAPTES